MTVHVEIRVGTQLVAEAHIQNTTDPESSGHLQGYGASATTQPWQGCDLQGYHVTVDNHDRRQSVWHLLKQVIDEVLAQEEARLAGPYGKAEGND